MARPIQWLSSVPAGADADTQYLIGAVPEGQKLMLSACSSFGGDAGERYSINVVPPGPNPNAGPVRGNLGQAQWLYPLAGGTQTLSDPLNVLCAIGWPHGLPGPCTLTIATTAASAAEMVVVLVGYLEDL